MESTMIPYISTYLYNNITGLPILEDITATNSSLFVPFNGDYFSFQYPYQIKIQSYSIIFQNRLSSVQLEAVPTTWSFVGWNIINNQIDVIDQKTNFVSTREKETFPIVNNTNVYSAFAFVIFKVLPKVTTNTGVCISGLFHFSLFGTPSLPAITIPPQSGILPPSSPIPSPPSPPPDAVPNPNIIGPTSFAGDSSFISVGDISTYGNIKIFKNIYTIPNHTITIHSNVKATTFQTTSDYRIKQNIQSLNQSHTVDDLLPVTYFNTVTKKQDFGLIAHQLQEIYPDLVYGEKDGIEHQSINYNGIISLLIHEIQSLKQTIRHNLIK
jgi:hypothetical protein